MYKPLSTMLVYLFLFLSFRTKQLNDKPTFCIIGGLGDLKKWGNYPRVIAKTVGGGYPPLRVIRTIRVRTELPCPPLLKYKLGITKKIKKKRFCCYWFDIVQ